MITKETADGIARAYREIENAEKLLAQVDEQLAKEKESRGFHGEINYTARPCQLGWPEGRDGYRLFSVEARVARAVIAAHLADQRAALSKLNEYARLETITSEVEA